MQRTALVTGGAVRVGRAIAEALADAGFHIAIHAHSSDDAARAVAAKLASASVHLADLTVDGGGERLAGEVAALRGRVDVLVNSAADFFPTPLGATTYAQWERLHALNLRAPYFLAQAVRPHMSPGGCIVNVADVAAEAPWPGYVSYGITKAGIVAMTLGLARELAPDIRVNAVSPGPVLLPERYDAEQRQRSIDRTLLGREGTPEDVARAVRFLVENEYVTGAVLPVDGGRRLKVPGE